MTADAAVSPALRLGLVGSPNAGKTTLFNALTGLRARVGNYPGVTVERREGVLRNAPRPALIVDLPGTYSLDALSPDEAIVGALLQGEVPGVAAPDALVIVADACSLERSLFLIGELLRRPQPACLALTMVDELEARGGKIDLERLRAALGIPVIPVVGHRGRGLEELRAQLASAPEQWGRPAVPPPSDPHELAGWADSIASHVIATRPGRHGLSERVDRVVLHPVAGVLLFLAVMTLFFQLVFAWAAPAMDAIDAAVGGLSGVVAGALPEGLLRSLLTDGVIAGVGSVVIFLPQILLLFGLLSLLEDLGYMARAAFVVDRAMARVGLEGRSFVALLSSYACAVPGIMATRTIPSPRDRLVTILVAPLMTCSARLPVYTLLIAAFVPAGNLGPFGVQGLVMMGLYLLGAAAAMGAAWALGRRLVPSDQLPFTLELPPYRVPTARLWISQVREAAWNFLKRAGTIILLVSILLWGLLAFPRSTPPAGSSDSEAASYQLEHSFAGQLGHAIEPVLRPLGFDWKIGVGLVASLAAREVIVATLAQIYAASDEERSLRSALVADIDPRTGEKVFTPATVASLLIFFVFALQCMSTLAVMRRETNSWRWPAFAFGYLLALAYGASFVTYRLVSAISARALS